MSRIAVIAGSPNPGSRLNGIIGYVENKWSAAGFGIETIRAAELPAQALLQADFKDAALLRAIAAVEQADGVVIAGPVYKASYSGLLKAFLDLLPQTGLQGKITLPLFIGGTIAHLLSVEYALKPVISALGGRHVLGGVYAVDQWVEKRENGGFSLSEELQTRLERAADEFAEELRWLEFRKRQQPAGVS
ncbi:NADPH-dependent FMN reductase [Cohnella sp. CFH 77786]|uniref:NADPH-dependent FMN reductase n=1 Tax=Cohnella sp. CFH 77786 TaxID=2662265 RepID=UPI001C60A68D|nr:NADPH-dependent FMN reductase [Cohnella sp. CFH 77786]MBW5449280.1 NADPH-dependent FMN reductase [Cohnella sp. CFH 77786]